MHWKPGTRILQREMWGERIGTARPVTVVEDSPDRLVLYSHPRTLTMTCGIKNRHSLSLSERIDMYMKMLDPDVGEFEQRISPNRHVLTLTPPDSWHSVWLLWSADWQLDFWYVNLQAPLRRTARGILSQDYALDIVVRPDMSWSWKDVDEFEELIKRGFFTSEQIQSIRAEGDRMVKNIENTGPPFCDGWESWRPDPDWPVPGLPDDWAAIGEATE